MRRSQRIRDAQKRVLQPCASDSGAGSEVVILSSVPEDSGGNSPNHQGKCGAAPLMATANKLQGGSGLGGHRACPPAPQRKCQRMKWSKEMNISVMRAYYKATKIETEQEGFRQRMFAIFKEMFPELQITEQRICDQKRVILLNNFLSLAELQNIKEEARMEIESQNDETADNTELMMTLPEIISNDYHLANHEEIQDTTTKESDTTTKESEKVCQCYESLKLRYHGILIQARPKIPKVEFSRHTMHIVTLVDAHLQRDLLVAASLNEVVSLVHCAALAVCQILGKTIRDQESKSTVTNKKVNIPPWIQRIEMKIKAARREIGVLTAYFYTCNNASKKVIRGVGFIARKMRISRNDKDFHHRLQEKLEQLKQRIAALGCRIRRYNEATKRRKQNYLFSTNQKSFYRRLDEGEGKELNQPPEAEKMECFWSGIWSLPVEHNNNTYWIENEELECQDLPQMKKPSLTLNDIRSVVRGTQNWKTPGVDGIQNFWWKYFCSTHSTLAEWFQRAIDDPTVIPDSFTEGFTVMLPKVRQPKDPKDYRPITCLPTVYKILTSILCKKMQEHIEENDLLPAEQNGCRKRTKGCKELLTIDTVITSQARKRKRNLSMGIFDYRKAYDSIPHSWLVKILRIYKFSDHLISLLIHCMGSWRTKLCVGYTDGQYKTNHIHISRGIYQGDSLSPLWFCLAMAPLSRLLRMSNMGYTIRRNPLTLLSHQFYMDDLKIYAKDRRQLQSMTELVSCFSRDICMEFGLDKCASVHVVRGDVQKSDGLLLMNGNVIQELGKEEFYKYLGMIQLIGISNTEMQDYVQKKVLQRITKITSSKLLGKNVIKAINTWAVPVATYSFGILKWSKTALESFDRKIRTMLTKHRIHHPHSSLARLYLPRREGGRGLLNLQTMCTQQIQRLRQYFLNNSEIHRAVCEADIGYTPLELSSDNVVFNSKLTEDWITEWSNKSLHGRFRTAFTSEVVHQSRSVRWLTSCGLFAETEGFLCSIQDEVVPTHAYKRHIIGDTSVSDKCRLCRQAVESVQHVAGGCSALVQKEYLMRHNNVAKVVHQALAKENGLVADELPYYKCKPEPVLCNRKVKLLWDMAITTDRAVEANRPDLVFLNKETREAFIIDIAVPLDHNITATIAEKRRKYQQLSVELRQMWNLKSIEILPIVITTNGLVPRQLLNVLEKLHMTEHHLCKMQKAALLGTASIVRKVLDLT